MIVDQWRRFGESPMVYTDAGEGGGPRKPSLIHIGGVENVVGYTMWSRVGSIHVTMDYAI